jgi:hypothetical protein
MMNEILETAGPYRVRLEVDLDPENPRTSQDNNLCHVITLKGSDRVDVDGTYGPLEGGWRRIKLHADAVGVFTRWARIFHGAVVEYHTPQEGANSIWYLLPEQFSEVPDPAAAVRAEIQEYQNWVDGEVYGYVIEKSVDWVRKDNPEESRATWEEEESCWGYVGYDYAKESALEEFAPYREKAEAMSK